MDAAPIIDVTDLQAGDLLACYGGDEVSRAISWGTASLLAPPRLRLGPSHVAIVAEPPIDAREEIQHNALLWYESTSLSSRPCLLSGKPNKGMQAHEPAERLADYRDGGGRVDVYRLTPLNRLWTHEGIMLAGLLGETIRRGTRYDMRGAVLSGLWQRSRVVLPLLSLAVTIDDADLFCSEVAAELLMRLGRLGREAARRFTPARLFRRVVRDNTYRLAGELRSRVSLYRGGDARRAA